MPRPATRRIISAFGLLNVWPLAQLTSVTIASIGLLTRFDADSLDHLAPFFRFVGDELAEVGGGAGKNRAGHFGEARLDLGVGEARVDLCVEPVDDLGGRVLGRADAKECALLEA